MTTLDARGGAKRRGRGLGVATLASRGVTPVEAEVNQLFEGR
jgi:hypothetical protein